MSETIFKGHRKGYAIVYRAVAQDKRLTLKARGLFLLMQSLPEDWNYTVAGLASVAGTGKDQIRAGLRELMNTGYLIKEQSHDGGGKFSGNVYILQEEAPLSENPTTVEKTASPLSEKPSTGKPSTVFPTLQNNKEQNKNKQKPPIVPHDVFDLCAGYAGEDGELLDALLGLLENRAAANKSPVKTTRAMNGILNKLDKLSGGDRGMKLALLEKATVSNWLTVFPLKPDEVSASDTWGEEGVTYI